MGENETKTFESYLLSQRSSAEVGFEVFLAIVILLVSVAGNVFVIYAIHSYRKLNTVTNILIENLAVTDICMALLHMPVWISTLNRGRWVLGHVMCQLTGATMLTFGSASLLTLGIISLYRYLKIVKRNLYSKIFKNRKTARIFCLAVWIFSAIVTTPPVYGWGGLEFVEKVATCAISWKIKHVSYIMVLLLGVLFLPTFLIFYAYIQIYRLVRANSLRMEGHYQSRDVASIHRTAQIARSKSQNKVLLTSFVIVCVFLVCWTPICIVGLSEMAGREQGRGFSMVAIYFMFCSSLANPFLYGILNPRFKEAFANIIKCFMRNGADDTGHETAPNDSSKPSS